ncbi:ABC transporter ATP-binding protein [Desulfoplanes formicivorans]|uniref:ABC transporter ATP-binding protein n=1 Tax=Desulfoplanes formicivorans TaxID=1592317 RepID=UPI0008529835|nr:oligopeptide/dipeptide ABC transporter ATP-binding protein [Desulfoplanes formicivorans]
MSVPFLELKNLTRDFEVRTSRLPARTTLLRAVDHVSLHVDQGQTLGLVGESGCGKSTLGQMVVGLVPPTRGDVCLQGRPLWDSGSYEEPHVRRKIQMIFQDPSSSLNPRMRVKKIIGEGLDIHRMGSRAQRTARVAALMEMTGILPEHGNRYAHEFSGGQRQRISLARALSLDPQLIVCDEPVSALDVSIQAQILNLLVDLQKNLGLTYIFISHDLAVVRKVSHRVAVMYLGRIVEIADGNDLYENPCHPYTRALLAAVPRPDPRRGVPKIALAGEIPSPLAPPSGCVFHPRCPRAMDICSRNIPGDMEVGPGHHVKCFLFKTV